MENRKNIFKQIDWVTIITYFFLIAYGWLNIYSSAFKGDANFDFTQRYSKQLLWIIIAIVIIIALFFVENNVYSALAYISYAFFMLLLIAVLIFGREINDSRSWIVIGSFRIQPAEFAKFATALALAKFMSKDGFKLSGNIKNILISGVIILLPASLIILQGDTGSALVYIVFILVLYREGLSFLWLFLILVEIILFVSSFFFSFSEIFIVLMFLGFAAYAVASRQYKQVGLILLILLGVYVIIWTLEIFTFTVIENHIIFFFSVVIFFIVSLIIAIQKRKYLSLLISGMVLLFTISTYSTDYVFHNIMQKHHRARINVLLGLEQDLKGIGYNVHQSKIAIGSGGFLGKGYLKGTQTKYDFVPEQDTDFIFCTVGEEWGFIGTSTVLLVFLFLVLRLVYLAERQRSVFSRIYGYAVSSILLFHFSVNIAMTIGLAPVIGIPLPFFSYGGSSLWAFTILLFIFLKLDTGREETF